MTRAAPIGVFGDRQQQARMSLFIGREREQETFRNLLVAGETPQIVYVHGPGGIGKSTLLHAFQYLSEDLGCAFTRLDARLIPANPQMVEQHVDDALRPLARDTDRPLVLALDHAEQWAALDRWLRTELLPQLPRNTVLLIGSRQAPNMEWHADPGITAFLTEFRLEPLSDEQAADYLQRRKVPDGQHASIVSFAHGNPLALALTTDHVLRSPGRVFDATASAGLFDKLAQWLLRDLEKTSHRHVVEACATVRCLDIQLLAAMLGREDVAQEFAWLTEQPYTGRQGQGLVIHDLLRDVVIRNLRAQDLSRHHRWIRRSLPLLKSRIEIAPDPVSQAERLAEMTYATRFEPFMQDNFPFKDGIYYPDVMRPNDMSALAEAVECMEGPDSRAWLEHWARQKRTEILVARRRDQTPAGLAVFVRFTAEDMAGPADDPAVALWLQYLREHAPLRGAEQAVLTRFIMGCETHHARTPVWAELQSYWLARQFRPGVSFFGTVVDLRYDLSRVDDLTDFQLLPGTAFSIDGRDCMILALDRRRESAGQYMLTVAERMLRDAPAPELKPPPIRLLERQAFNAAVRDALAQFADDASLADNPLLHAPMLRRHSAEYTPQALRQLIRETSDHRFGDDQGNRGGAHEVLRRVYFEPAPKLRAVAADLHMSERTLRRRLRAAEDRLADALWRLDTQMD